MQVINGTPLRVKKVRSGQVRSPRKNDYSHLKATGKKMGAKKMADEMGKGEDGCMDQDIDHKH